MSSNNCSICKQRICAIAVENGAKYQGAGILALTDSSTFIAGFERAGSYSGKANIGCGGSNYGECCLITAFRENEEELKFGLTFDQYVKYCVGVIVLYGTAVFIINYPNLNFSQIKRNVESAVGSNLSWCLQEMSTVAKFNINYKDPCISSFTNRLVEMYKNNNYFTIPTFNNNNIIINNKACKHNFCEQCFENGVTNIKTMLTTNYYKQFPAILTLIKNNDFCNIISKNIANKPICYIKEAKDLMAQYNMPTTGNLKTTLSGHNNVGGIIIATFVWDSTGFSRQQVPVPSDWVCVAEQNFGISLTGKKLNLVEKSIVTKLISENKL